MIWVVIELVVEKVFDGCTDRIEGLYVAGERPSR